MEIEDSTRLCWLDRQQHAVYLTLEGDWTADNLLIHRKRLDRQTGSNQ